MTLESREGRREEEGVERLEGRGRGDVMVDIFGGGLVRGWGVRDWGNGSTLREWGMEICRGREIAP